MLVPPQIQVFLRKIIVQFAKDEFSSACYNLMLTEPETPAIRDAVLAKKGQWNAFFTIHSYGKSSRV